jgi:hypothetical protein
MRLGTCFDRRQSQSRQTREVTEIAATTMAIQTPSYAGCTVIESMRSSHNTDRA